MQSMSHRERVVAALAHRQPDRVPIDLGTTVVTGIALKTYDRLKAHLGLDLGDAQVYDRRNQLAVVDDAVLDRSTSTRAACRPAHPKTARSSSPRTRKASRMNGAR